MSKSIQTLPVFTAGRAAESAPAVRPLLASLSLAMLLSSLGTSIANIALPTLATSFLASFAAVQWVVLGYLLAITTLIVGAGRLGDLIGRRRLLLVGIGLFTIASGFGGFAPSLGWLIAARVMQGGGAAIMMALTMAFVGEAVPKARTGSAMGLLGTMSALGTALGPSLGGVLIAAEGWRAIFLINLPLGVTAWMLAQRYLPADRAGVRATTASFDRWGTVLLALTLGAYALGVTLGRGPFGWFNLGLLAASAVGAGLFVVAETKAASPLVELRMFRETSLSASLATNALVSTVMMATLVVGPFYLSRALGLEAASVGLVMSVGPVVAALTGVPAGRLVDRLGVRRVTLAGLAGVALGAMAITALLGRLGVAAYVGPIVVITAGYALYQAANNTAVMAKAGPERRGVLSGLLNLSRNLGLVTGASAMGALFAFASGSSDLTSAPPEHVASGMRATFAVAALLAGGGFAVAAGWGSAKTPSVRARGECPVSAKT